MASGPIGQRVFVPFDGSPRSAQAFPLALGLAAPGGTVTVYHVEEGRNDDTAGDLPRVAASLGQHAPEGVAVDTATGAGDVAEAIVAAAVAATADLIVMSTRGHGGVARLAFGSVTADVIRASQVPVAVIHDRDEQIDSALGETSRGADVFRRILLPLDGTDVSARSMPVAAELAARFDAPVVVISTVNLVPMAAPGMVQDAGMLAGIDEIYEETRQAAGEWLAATQADLERRGVRSSTEFLTGAPAPAIEAIAEDGDLIVMATHGRKGLDRLLSGSVTDALVRSGAAPVLVIPVGMDQA